MMMFDALCGWTGLPLSHLAFSAGMALLAGAVRGFSGFGLSAVLMASIVVILPPIDLIPVCFLLEAAASLVMFRGGFRDADLRTALTLAICSAIGVPIGLSLTTSLPVDLSKLLALLLVLTLVGFQLLKVTLPLDRSRLALPGTGLTAGIVSGLASVGGMVIALYILNSARAAREMRGALVLYLFFGMLTSSVTLVWFGLLNQTGLARGAVLAPMVLIGVFAGSRVFGRTLDQTYKRSCLYLLAVFACAGLIRLVLF